MRGPDERVIARLVLLRRVRRNDYLVVADGDLEARTDGKSVGKIYSSPASRRFPTF